MTPLVAVVDIGKSNAKLSLVDVESGHTLWSVRRPNQIVQALNLRQLDIFAIEDWLLDSLKVAPHKERVSAIVPIAHGAAAVLIDEGGQVLTAPDYEDPAFDMAGEDYEIKRDPFEDTFSPSLPLGLNLGRQWDFLEQHRPQLFARAGHALLYPQYWAWRFSGEMASEVTSLGCHSDLWRPQQKTFSALVYKRCWERLFPPLRFAGESLGSITARVARITGLNSACRVYCGIHDSNASFLQHLLGAHHSAFCAISSGTWTVTMARGTDLSHLRADRDMLANVDAYSFPVPTARFMGGREYESIAQTNALPDANALESVLRKKMLALPSFAPGGPFPDAKGTLSPAQLLSDPERAVLATLYVALMTDLSIDLLQAHGDLFLDGPLGSNPLFGALLAGWRPTDRVFVTGRSNGCNGAAVFLGGFTFRDFELPSALKPLQLAGLAEYRHAWRELLPDTDLH
jgi:L-fuculokinase